MNSFEINVVRKTNGWLIVAIERDDINNAGAVVSELVATTPAQVAAAVRSLAVSREKQEVDDACDEEQQEFETAMKPRDTDDQMPNRLPRP